MPPAHLQTNFFYRDVFGVNSNRAKGMYYNLSFWNKITTFADSRIHTNQTITIIYGNNS